MDRNLRADVKAKSFADCVAERRDMWRLESYAQPVQATVDAMVRAIRSGGRVYFFGNGGSAAQAQHFAAELSGRFLKDRPAWGALALSVDTSALTAIANDYGFEHVFARQLQGLVSAGDVACGLTTSGTSANVIAGLAVARRNAAVTVAFTGNGGGTIVAEADIALVGPDGPSWKVQEVHLVLGHIICELVELALTVS
ncbi:MAG: SIS domain-containing protein [Candidatus Eremiobacteraeota bacterium]|nr:SIS domain-containing protein [Candidatus Eremiobacteraeota bacterium]MBC5808219.1 SIS domain-containing protein [Candidatus Eremiobacteraeota bacterium]